ncbi:aldehyde dehydrogenase family protein [Paenibacillus alginolyticus]|uniref:aldehyde dehydrogenase family protein n=1 Tax=Paenibacillus alginolyticus TaxID=59839 RepID=UPI0004297C84|nr:aldehyde dehydrogenase family protein [Paenibacillus alginolyticus]MCY9665792.1 aldehyde dehydrogenase family protein [Paenibacillus alginolyticus]
MLAQKTKKPLFIGGEWVETSEIHPIYNKYTGELYVQISKAGEIEKNAAIEAAENAFKQSEFGPAQRFQVLMNMYHLLIENLKEFAEVIAAEGGKPIVDAMTEVNRSATIFLLSAEEANKITGEMIPTQVAPNLNIGKRLIYTIKKPIGIVCAITPFNFPLNLVVHKVAPALAAGNPVIIKPASDTAYSALKLCELLEKAGLPKGFVSCLVGNGSTLGDQLLTDQRIHKYTFTGSPEVGMHIHRTIGMRKVTLELGSNSATIVHKDADVEVAATKLARMSFAHAGQVCISVQRIYVHKDIEQKFMEVFIKSTESLKVGDPLDPSTLVGPMISEKEAVRIEGWVNEAVACGAKILTGGKREKNVYYPTILTGATKGMKVIDEEVFAPVVSITSYDSIDDAIRMVNDSKYGLQAGVFTKSVSLAHTIPYLLEVGGVIINDTSSFRADQMPYGGVKESGMGKEGPAFAIEEMLETVTVAVNLEE